MICNKCPLALLCLTGELHLMKCPRCQLKFILLPYSVDSVMSKLITHYAIFECTNSTLLTFIYQRFCPNCVKDKPISEDYLYYKLLGPGYV